MPLFESGVLFVRMNEQGFVDLGKRHCNILEGCKYSSGKVCGFPSRHPVSQARKKRCGRLADIAGNGIDPQSHPAIFH
jgi:hypothetical protein